MLFYCIVGVIGETFLVNCTSETLLFLRSEELLKKYEVLIYVTFLRKCLVSDKIIDRSPTSQQKDNLAERTFTKKINVKYFFQV